MIQKRVKKLICLQKMQKETYENVMRNYFNTIQQNCTAYQIKYVPVSVGENFEKIITTYLVEKQKFG